MGTEDYGYWLCAKCGAVTDKYAGYGSEWRDAAGTAAHRCADGTRGRVRVTSTLRDFARDVTERVVAVEGTTTAPPLAMALRPAVARFAELMEAKLRANDHKGGWHDDPPEELLLRAYEELGEFHVAFARRFKQKGDAFETRAGLAREAADAANMLMMTLDQCGALDRQVVDLVARKP